VNSVLALSGVSKAFGSVPALHDASLGLYPAEAHAPEWPSSTRSRRCSRTCRWPRTSSWAVNHTSGEVLVGDPTVFTTAFNKDNIDQFNL
jgi:hypothetical protein